MDKCSYKKVLVRDKGGNVFYVLYDESRQLLFFNYMTVEFAMNYLGYEFVEESEVKEHERVSSNSCI